MWPWSKTPKAPRLLDDDPRWQRFLGHSGPCACCGQTLNGVFDIGFDHPDPWPHGSLAPSGQTLMEFGEDTLTQDLCKLDGHSYFRGVLQLPIQGSDKVFGYGAWGTLSEENWLAYQNNAATGAPFDGAFTWIANSLPTFETSEFLPAEMVVQPDGLRPLILPHEGTPLHRAQSEGITFDHLLDIYAASGSDIRPHL